MRQLIDNERYENERQRLLKKSKAELVNWMLTVGGWGEHSIKLAVEKVRVRRGGG